MIKILLIITALVIFWALFGKWIMKLLNFSLKIAFRVFAIIIGILMILSLASNAQTVTYDATSIWSGVEKDRNTEIVDSLVVEVSKVDTTKASINYDFFSVDVERDTIYICEDKLKKDIKETYNDVVNLFDQISDSDEFKNAENEVIDFTKKSVTIIGKYSHIIYIEGKKFYRYGSDWFTDGWNKVEDKEEIKLLDEIKTLNEKYD